jgi:hydroxymethylglutaryl-CoA reductase (NADPH)
MPTIPPFILKKLYVKGSLHNDDTNFALSLKNLVAPATITSFDGLVVDGRTIDTSQATLELPNGKTRSLERISPTRPLEFPIGTTLTLRVADETLEPGSHDLFVEVDIKEIGSLSIPVSDTLA